MMFFLALVAVALLTTAAFWLFDRARRRHIALLVKEKSSGQEKVIKTLSGQVGRRNQPDRKGTVQKAKHMRGWVFIVVSRPPLTGPNAQQYVGWALTRRGAKRKLDRYLNGERGSSGLVGIALVLVGLFIVANYAPDLLAKVFRADVVAWLQRTGSDLWDTLTTWLRGL